MPSDDTDSFRTSQTKHAEEIKMRRAISRLTGLTPNQVRDGLRSASGLNGVRGKGPSVAPGPAKGYYPETPAPSPVLKFEPKPFSPQGPEGTQVPVDVSTLLNDIIVNINGTLYYTNLKTDGRLEAV